MKLNRRAFLASSAVAAGGALVLGFRLFEHGQIIKATPTVTNPLDAWIKIHPDGKVILVVEKSEMGQGVYTGLPMILAEEAELDWSTVSVEQSLQSTGTGGSGSTIGGYLPLRKAGATVRTLMIAAAAGKWSVSQDDCFAQQSRVIHRTTGKSLSYAELVPAARVLPLPNPDQVSLKKPEDFKLIGHTVPRLDTPDKVTGTARFGLDIRLPGMVFAVVSRCPTFGGKISTYDASRALAVPGVLQVFPIEPRGLDVKAAGGVVVVAQSTWAALQGRDALKITWDRGPHKEECSGALRKDLYDALAREGKMTSSKGNVDEVLSSGAKKIQARYEFPFLAHATMEPMNTTIHLKGNVCEVWCPTQSADWAHSAIAKELGLPESQVTVHTTFMGGGFGRRYIADYPTEAAQIAKQVNGPVQLVWTREDDMTHDFYRQASCHDLIGVLDQEGKVCAWSHHIASTSLRALWDPPDRVKPESAEVGGVEDQPYVIPNRKVCYTPVESSVPRGWWRSIAHSFNGFVVECFVDELASAAKQDPYQFRRALLAKPPLQDQASAQAQAQDTRSSERGRLLAALDLVAQKAGWGKPMAPHQGRGIGCAHIYGGYLAQVAEVTVKDDIRVDRIVTVVDCGQIVNPDGVRSQIEGAIIFALSAVLKGEITISAGQVQQKNFDSYDPIRMQESPLIEVHLVENHLDLGGIGEAGIALVGPTVANAIYAATGKRLRRLPLQLNRQDS